jgi:hypothetical protein
LGHQWEPLTLPMRRSRGHPRRGGVPVVAVTASAVGIVDLSQPSGTRGLEPGAGQTHRNRKRAQGDASALGRSRVTATEMISTTARRTAPKRAHSQANVGS